MDAAVESRRANLTPAPSCFSCPPLPTRPQLAGKCTIWLSAVGGFDRRDGEERGRDQPPSVDSPLSALSTPRRDLNSLCSYTFLFFCSPFAASAGNPSAPETRNNSDTRRVLGVREVEEGGRRRASVSAPRLPRLLLLVGVQVTYRLAECALYTNNMRSSISLKLN